MFTLPIHAPERKKKCVKIVRKFWLKLKAANVFVPVYYTVYAYCIINILHYQ